VSAPWNETQFIPGVDNLFSIVILLRPLNYKKGSELSRKDIFLMSLGDELPELLTVKEVATFLRVSPLTIKRWGKRGKLPAIRINARGDRRYKKEAVLWLLGEMKKEVA
jgi:excisionase family DNA binding protein